MKLVSLVLVLGISTPQPSQAQEPPQRFEHGQELVSLSGASSVGRALLTEHRILVWTLAKPPSGEALEALRSLVRTSFPLDTTTARIRQACDARYNPAQFDQIIAWFRTPLGRAVVEAERSAAFLDDAPSRKIREQVRSQWVSTRRMLLLGRLDDNLGLGYLQGVSALRLLEDLITSLNRESPPGKSWSEAQVQSRLNEATDRLQSRLRDSVLFELRVTYRSLSNDHLQGYNEFLESFSGRWYVELLQQGLEDAFLEGRGLFLEGLSRIPPRLRRTLLP